MPGIASYSEATSKDDPIIEFGTELAIKDLGPADTRS